MFWTAAAATAHGGHAMSFDPNQDRLHDGLLRCLREAPTMTTAVITEVIGQACPRYHRCSASTRARIGRLIDERAWLEASLLLLEIELPQWRPRRLICDDGVWHCSLSRQPAIPFELDELADAAHESLPLAVLSALVEARRMGLAGNEAKPKIVPQIRLSEGRAICCDNFA
jgi:hypothetical protein